MAVFAFSNDRKTERFQSLYVPFETGLEMDMIDFHSLELPDESEVEWDRNRLQKQLFPGPGITPGDRSENRQNK